MRYSDAEVIGSYSVTVMLDSDVVVQPLCFVPGDVMRKSL